MTHNGVDVTSIVLDAYQSSGVYSYTVSNISQDVALNVSFGDSAIADVDRAYVKANKDKAGFVLVDVRPEEYYDGKSFSPGVILGGHIAGAINVPRSDIEAATADQLPLMGLDPDKTIILYCNMGSNSAAVAQILAGHGYSNLKNYAGGMQDWSQDVDEVVVIASQEISVSGQASTLSVDVPEGTSVTWSIVSPTVATATADAVIELSATTGTSVDVIGLRPGTAVVRATVDGMASTECEVIVLAASGSGGGCDIGLAPAAVLLLLPLVLLKK